MHGAAIPGDVRVEGAVEGVVRGLDAPRGDIRERKAEPLIRAKGRSVMRTGFTLMPMSVRGVSVQTELEYPAASGPCIQVTGGASADVRGAFDGPRRARVARHHARKRAATEVATLFRSFRGPPFGTKRLRERIRQLDGLDT